MEGDWKKFKGKMERKEKGRVNVREDEGEVEKEGKTKEEEKIKERQET
jgi:hypothetical protein